MTIWFFCGSVLYIILACGAYHVYMESVRLEQRAEKVIQIEHGEADWCKHPHSVKLY